MRLSVKFMITCFFTICRHSIFQIKLTNLALDKGDIQAIHFFLQRAETILTTLWLSMVKIESWKLCFSQFFSPKLFTQVSTLFNFSVPASIWPKKDKTKKAANFFSLFWKQKKRLFFFSRKHFEKVHLLFLSKKLVAKKCCFSNRKSCFHFLRAKTVVAKQMPFKEKKLWRKIQQIPKQQQRTEKKTSFAAVFSLFNFHAAGVGHFEFKKKNTRTCCKHFGCSAVIVLVEKIVLWIIYDNKLMETSLMFRHWFWFFKRVYRETFIIFLSLCRLLQSWDHKSN